MKRKNVIICGIVLSAMVLINMNCGPAPVDKAKIRKAIEAQNEKFMEAVSNGDAAALADLYTENGQTMPPNSDIVTGKEAIQQGFQSMIDMGIKKLTLNTIEVDGMGETVYEVGKYSIFVDGDKITDSGKYIVIWKDVKGIWKLHRDIWNSSLAAPEQQ